MGLFGVIQEPNHSLEALLALYKRPAFIIYFSILESFILVTMVTTHLLEHFYHQWEEDMTPDQKLLGSWLSMADLKVYIGIRYFVVQCTCAYMFTYSSMDKLAMVSWEAISVVRVYCLPRVDWSYSSLPSFMVKISYNMLGLGVW